MKIIYDDTTDSFFHQKYNILTKKKKQHNKNMLKTNITIYTQQPRNRCHIFINTKMCFPQLYHPFFNFLCFKNHFS